VDPDDIRSREFTVRSDGYDPAEVDRVMDQVAATIERLGDADTPSTFADVGKAAQRVLEAADQSASEILAEARSEAERLRSEARRDREQAARDLEELEQRQEEHAETQRRAHAAIRTAGESTRQLLVDAAQPREKLMETLAHVRDLLIERFDDAEQMAVRTGQRADEVVRELEVDLPLDLDSGSSGSSNDPRHDGLSPTAGADVSDGGERTD
jgi:DivIVA domain-containing protein